MSAPNPIDIKLHQRSRLLEISFDDGARFELSCEMLRVYSPSAEVRGHSPDQAVLQTGLISHCAEFQAFSDGSDGKTYKGKALAPPAACP